MALETAMKQAVRRVVSILRDYAGSQDWGPDDYRIFVEPVEEWGRIHIMLVVKAFPRKLMEDSWATVVDYLETRLADDPALFDSINLSLHTFDQVKRGGLSSIGPGYIDADQL